MLIFKNYKFVNAIRQEKQDYDLLIKLYPYRPGEALRVAGS
jgi:hypothetical protein